MFQSFARPPFGLFLLRQIVRKPLVRYFRSHRAYFVIGRRLTVEDFPLYAKDNGFWQMDRFRSIVEINIERSAPAERDTAGHIADSLGRLFAVDSVDNAILAAPKGTPHPLTNKQDARFIRLIKFFQHG